MGDAGTSDSHIRWDATDLHLASAGKVRMSCGGLKVNNLAGTETILNSTENGWVELYHDISKKFETAAHGVTVQGELRIEGQSSSGNTHFNYNDGGDNYITKGDSGIP